MTIDTRKIESYRKAESIVTSIKHDADYGFTISYQGREQKRGNPLVLYLYEA